MVFNYSLHPEADATKHAPFKKTLKDAGFDVPAFLPDGPVCIPAKGSIVIPTAIKTHFPATHVALVRSRSGLSVKHNIEIGAGAASALPSPARARRAGAKTSGNRMLSVTLA